LFTSEGSTGEHRLIGYISKDEELVRDIHYECPTEQSSRKAYKDYLKSKLLQIDPEKSETEKWLYMGLLSRQVEILVNEGKYEEAEAPISDLKSVIESEYSTSINSFENIVKEISDEAEKESFETFIDKYHPCMGRFFHAYGMWHLNYKENFIDGYNMFTHSENLIESELANSPHFRSNRNVKDSAKKHRKISLERKLNEIKND
jgi:hypothetical protein